MYFIHDVPPFYKIVCCHFDTHAQTIRAFPRLFYEPKKTRPDPTTVIFLLNSTRSECFKNLTKTKVAKKSKISKISRGVRVEIGPNIIGPTLSLIHI